MCAVHVPPALDDSAIADILSFNPVVAVLGIHDDQARPAAYVPSYLHDAGYRVLGVNPVLAGHRFLGAPIYATLGDLIAAEGPVDLIDVFRRPEALPAHQAELIAAAPRVVWFQLGIRNDAVAAELHGAGITVVQDRCTLADHRRLALGAPRELEESSTRPDAPSSDEFAAAWQASGGNISALARQFGRDRKQIYRWATAAGFRSTPRRS